MPKKVKIILIIVWILAATAYYCSHSKAEAATPDPALFPIPTFNPDPEVGYKDYLELMKTPEPTPCQRSYEEDFPPEYSPTPNPFDVTFSPSPSGSVTFSYSSVRSNNYVARIVNGVRRYYRGLTGNLDTVPPTQGGTNIKTDEYGWYTPTNLFSQNCRLYSSNDYLFMGMYFTGVSGIPLGSTLTLGGIWTSFFPTKLLPTVGLEYANEPQVNFHFTLKYASGVYQFYDLVCSVEDIQKGISYPIEVVDNISDISIEIMFSNTLAPDDAGNVSAIYFTSAEQNNYYSISAFVSLPADSQETNAINKQTSAIGRFFENFLNGITGLFIPNGDELQSFINSKVQGLESTPVGLAWSYGIRWLNILYSADDTLPTLRVPAYSISVNGSTYQLFSSFDIDFTAIPQNLITYAHMIGDIILALAFVRYLGAKMVMLFNIKFADTILEIDSDDTHPSMFV